VLREERAMLDFAKWGRNTVRSYADQPYRFGPVQGEGGKTFELSGEQKAAAASVLRSTDRVTAIRGAAGSGKTSMMKETIKAIRETSSQEVLTIAPTSGAVDVLRDKEKLKDAHTVARFLIDRDLQQQIRGQTIWVDEAGLLGTRDLHRVFEIAEKQEARIILSGDVRQHKAVTRGDSLRLLEQNAGVKTIELSKITRQQVDSYRDAVATIAKGDVLGGFDRLDQLGLVRADDDMDRRYKALAADYVNTAVERKQEVLVVAPTHSEGATATAAIRDALKEAGQLGEERKFVSLKNRNLTEAERRDALSYREGDVVQVMQNLKGFTRGDRLTVLGRDDQGQVIVERQQAPPPGKFRVPGVPARDTLPLDKAEHFQVYEAEKLTLAVGDKIRISQNGFTRDKKRLSNGSVYEVKGFTKGGTPGDPFSDGNIILSNGKVLNKDFGHVTHGYVSTSHASQGRSVDAVLIAQASESRGASGKEQWYVSVSRGKKEVRVYTDDTAKLRGNIQQTTDRLSATELLQHGTEEAVPQRRRIRDRVEEQIELLRRQASDAWTAASRVVEAVRETYGRWTERIQRERGWEPEPPELTR
jgi:ATP-dependent exoDNAse (exonuclease V) alpha subunit